MEDALLSFHQNWVYVAVISNGLVGLWGLTLAVVRRPPGRVFANARAVAITAMLIQVVVGALLLSRGLVVDGFHVFYGVVIAVTLALAYVYRAQLARRPALAYGLLLLFVMGLGIRAWIQVA
jgi:hypothetical protein